MSSVAVYLASLVLLFAKYVVAITVQARERLSVRHFRYTEDAVCWNGTVAADSDLCQRAQSLLRNDCENQTFFIAFGAAYVALELWPAGALFYFGGYAVSRLAHAYFMLRARQPHRTRAFSVSVLILALLALHLLYATLTVFAD